MLTRFPGSQMPKLKHEPCAYCVAFARFSVRIESGELVSVCQRDYLKITDSIREEGDDLPEPEWFQTDLLFPE